MKKIIVLNLIGSHHAYVEGMQETTTCVGKSSAEAVGICMLKHQAELGVEIAL